MNIPGSIIVILIVATLISGAIMGRVLKRHRTAMACTLLTAIAVACTTAMLCFNTRSFDDWHTFVYVQWWIFANLIAILLTLPTATGMLLTRRLARARWAKNRGRLTMILAMPGIVASGMCMYGATIERYNYEVRRMEVELENLPEAFDGYGMVLISDAHVGSLNGDTTLLSAAIDSVNACEGDMVLFLGDLVNCYAEEADGFEPLFRRIKATKRYAIYGNHDIPFEYHNWTTEDIAENVDRIVAKIGECGFTILDEKWMYVTAGEDSILFGSTRDYSFAWHHGTIGETDTTHVKVLMSHSPYMFPKMDATMKADLTMCGHTHGGQMGLRFDDGSCLTMARTRYKYEAGLYHVRNEGRKDSYLYINAGLGVNGLPMRLGIKPEITHIILRRANTTRP